MANINPFRRKHMQILGLDNASFVSTKTNRSSEDGASTISHFSDKGSAASLNSRSNSTRKASVVSHDLGDDSDVEKRSGSRGDAGSMLSAYAPSLEEEDDNPFEEEIDDDSLDELEDKPMTLRRRRTVPSKAASRLDADRDNPWRSSTVMGNHPMLRRGSPDSSSIPLKAQKTLGLAKKSRPAQEDYRRGNALSTHTENVAPKAQRMLGIPTNPWQSNQPRDDRHFFHDELEREGSRGPTTTRKPTMDVDEFKRLILSGERNPYFPHSLRDSSSNTDMSMSSISRNSILSSQPDTHIETPRSSHEYYRKPHLTRIATDSIVSDVSSNMTEPWSNRTFSPLEMGDSSPVLNKPLPKTPEHTFELAGSEVTPSGRRRKVRQGVPESIEELPSPQMIAELPAEPIVVHEAPTLSPLPGSSAAPIELPAREASPIDPPVTKMQSLNWHFGRNAPAPPPPRRSGSARSSLEVPRLTTQASEPILNQKQRPAPPPTRGSSTRLDRSIAQSLPPANIPSPAPKNAPAPPPSRSTDELSEERPVTPDTVQPTIASPLSRLPPLQTTSLKNLSGSPSSGTPIVSAITRNSTVNSPGGVSTMSPTSPASRRTGLGLISRAAGLNVDRDEKEGLKPQPREPKAQHQREWSWEPGKIDRIDSIKKSGAEESKHDDLVGETIQEEHESDEELDHGLGQDDTTDETSKFDVLAGLDELKRDVDEAIKGSVSRPRSTEILDNQDSASTSKDLDAKAEDTCKRNEADKTEDDVQLESPVDGNSKPVGNWI